MNWLKKAWDWLSVDKNQKTLTFIGGGLAALVVAIWQGYLHFSTHTEISKPVVTLSDSGITKIDQSTTGDSSATVISKVPLNGKNIVQKTEGKDSPAIISGGDVSVTSER